MGKKKNPKTPQPHWEKLVSVWFKFCMDKYSERPTFDGSSPRDLLSIVKALKERAESKDIEWTEDVATARLQRFLSFAHQDPWLNKNWLLSNLNRQKEKIFFNLAKISNDAPVAPY